jgi:hypothetical protein
VDQYQTIDQIRADHQRWFSPDAMRFFHTRVIRSSVLPVPGGGLFVTSDHPDAGLGARRYTVRHATVGASVNTVGEFMGHETLGQASEAARAEQARLVRRWGDGHDAEPV